MSVQAHALIIDEPHGALLNFELSDEDSAAILLFFSPSILGILFIGWQLEKENMPCVESKRDKELRKRYEEEYEELEAEEQLEKDREEELLRLTAREETQI